MTPLMIDIGIHYYCCAEDYRGGNFSAPAVSEAIDKFVEAGLLEPTPPGCSSGMRYRRTDGLDMWVEALAAVPWPVTNLAITCKVGRGPMDPAPTNTYQYRVTLKPSSVIPTVNMR